jgi:Ca2+-transporting ATPase
MSEILIGEILLDIALLLGLTFLLGGLLERVHVPVILGALLVAMTIHYTPLGTRLLSGELYPVFSFMADFGVMLLLFFIGLQIDMKEMRSQSVDIVWLTILNTSLPFVLGMLVMLLLGYGWVLAFVIGLTRMPTAEAVIVPILDEFDMIRTRVGNFIVGAGVLDDVIEVFLVAFVSVWIGERAVSGSIAGTIENEVLRISLSIALFLLMAWLAYRWFLPRLAEWLPRKPQHLLMLSMLLLLGLAGFSEFSGLGMVVGAIIAGVAIRPVYNRLTGTGDKTLQSIRILTYGFFGPVFFFWVGLSVDLEGMVREPLLALLLFLAAVVGKLLGALIMVPMKKLSILEAWTIGIGINARLTTEIIVAKLLLDARLIDIHLFTALVAASSLSTILVPLLFTWLVRRWGTQLKGVVHTRQVQDET